MPLLPTPTAAERFWAKVDRRGDDECWMWVGAVKAGKPRYGSFHLRRGESRSAAAHRFSFELHYGPIPDGLMVDHRCHEYLCVNPKHLRLATRQQNMENRPGAARNSKSGVRGVVWDTQHGRWRVQVRSNRQLYNGGRFDRMEDAEAAAIALRNRLMTHNDVDRKAS